MSKITLFIVIAILVMLIMFSIFAIVRSKELDEQERKNREEVKEQKGIINKLNHSDLIKNNTFGKLNSNMETLFNRAKNPWNMSIATFQFIRYGGLIAFGIIAIIFLFINSKASVFFVALGLICFIYPYYYYKATGNEREAEWNKFYEFVWVLKHNVMLYDPAKAYMNTKMYIQKHAPHNKEIIQGFDDFYRYWSNDGIDEYLTKYYCFSVPREIIQIVYNMNKTGIFPEDSLNALRSFIINAQNLTVEKTLSSVSGKATMFSLPFMMFSVIIALMVPMIFQLVQFL